MDNYRVVYYNRGKKTEMTIKNVTKIESDKNLLMFFCKGDDSHAFLMSDVLSYKKLNE